MPRKTTYIGFFLDNEKIEQLKIVSYITKKSRSELIREGLENIMETHKDAFEKFAKMVEAMKKKNGK